jgi:hypothetical protein
MPWPTSARQGSIGHALTFSRRSASPIHDDAGDVDKDTTSISDIRLLSAIPWQGQKWSTNDGCRMSFRAIGVAVVTGIVAAVFLWGCGL